MFATVIKILLPAALSFFVGILLTPMISRFLYAHKMWKKVSRSAGTEMTSSFKAVHNAVAEVRTPRIGGIVIWIAVLGTTVGLFLLSRLFPNLFGGQFDIISRNQTYIPLATLIIGSLAGLFDDFLQIRGLGKYAADAMVFRYVKIVLVSILGLVVGWWFYSKLGMTSIHIPFDGMWHVGIFFIPLFVLVTLATFSTSVIDGIDGLAGGVLASVFAAYTAIAFFTAQYDLSALCAVITGGILAFLWFNIPPARFYMGETGMVGLSITLATVAFLTDTVLVLPIIALPLVVTSASNIIQLISKKYFKKRVFRIAPLHHHLEAIGWSSYKVTMRYWIISVVAAIIGVIVAILG